MVEQGKIFDNLPQPYSDYVFFAMMIVYKDVSKVSFRQAAVIKFLKAVTDKLKKIIEEKSNDSKHTIISSAFVNQCNSANVRPDNENARELKNRRSATLLDLYAEHAAEYNFKPPFCDKEKEEPTTESIPELLNNLVDKDNKKHVNLVKGNALSHAIEDFLKTLMKACGIVTRDIKDLIENAKKQQAMFIPLNDLSGLTWGLTPSSVPIL